MRYGVVVETPSLPNLLDQTQPLMDVSDGPVRWLFVVHGFLPNYMYASAGVGSMAGSGFYWTLLHVSKELNVVADYRSERYLDVVRRVFERLRQLVVDVGKYVRKVRMTPYVELLKLPISVALSICRRGGGDVFSCPLGTVGVRHGDFVSLYVFGSSFSTAVRVLRSVVGEDG